MDRERERKKLSQEEVFVSVSSATGKPPTIQVGMRRAHLPLSCLFFFFFSFCFSSLYFLIFYFSFFFFCFPQMIHNCYIFFFFFFLFFFFCFSLLLPIFVVFMFCYFDTCVKMREKEKMSRLDLFRPDAHLPQQPKKKRKEKKKTTCEQSIKRIT